MNPLLGDIVDSNLYNIKETNVSYSLAPLDGKENFY